MEIENKEPPTQKNTTEYLYNQDPSNLNSRELARYVIVLTQELDTVRGENQQKFNILQNKIPSLQKRFQEVESSLNGVSEMSKELMSALRIAIGNLKEALEIKEKPLPYIPLQNALTDEQIFGAQQEVDETLNSGATAILIGVGKYSHAGVSELVGPTKHDVPAVAQKLGDYTIGSIKPLLDDQATKSNILETIRNSPIDKPIFLYFSGHGIKGHLVPYLEEPLRGSNKIEKTQDGIGKSISPKELFEAIGSRKAVVVADNCYGGDLTVLAPDNIVVISASDSRTRAAETDDTTGGFQQKRNTEKDITFLEDDDSLSLEDSNPSGKPLGNNTMSVYAVGLTGLNPQDIGKTPNKEVLSGLNVRGGVEAARNNKAWNFNPTIGLKGK